MTMNRRELILGAAAAAVVAAVPAAAEAALKPIEFSKLGNLNRNVFYFFHDADTGLHTSISKKDWDEFESKFGVSFVVAWDRAVSCYTRFNSVFGPKGSLRLAEVSTDFIKISGEFLRATTPVDPGSMRVWATTPVDPGSMRVWAKYSETKEVKFESNDRWHLNALQWKETTK